jgi:sec-independent protein translocase protein TatA
MFGLGMSELMIVMVIVLLVFGGSKISGVGRSLGEAITEFKDALKPDEKDKSGELKHENASAKKEATESAAADKDND